MRERCSRRLERKDFYPVAERRDTGGKRDGGTPKERAGETEGARYVLCTTWNAVEGPRSHLIWTADNQ